MRYLKPTPLEGPVTLRARVAEAGARKTVLTCTLYADDQARAEAAVVAGAGARGVAPRTGGMSVDEITAPTEGG